MVTRQATFQLDFMLFFAYSRSMRKLHHPLKKEIELANVLYALGDPIRLEIVKNLAKMTGKITETAQVVHHRSCKNICTKLRLSKSTLSHHFRILREAGVIWCEKDGTQYVNRLRQDDLSGLFPGLLDCIVSPSLKPVKSKPKKTLKK
jgi:DNA-binding transcriptional ArsR family regulator